MAATPNMEQALTQQVDAVHGEGDDEAEAVKARITEETGKYQTIQNLVTGARASPSMGASYAAASALLSLCGGPLANTERFAQEVVEAMAPPNLSTEIAGVQNCAIERLAEFLPGQQECMAALDSTKQVADAELVPDEVLAFQEQQQALLSSQQDKNKSLKLVKDPFAEVAEESSAILSVDPLVDSLRNCGEIKRVALTSVDELDALRTGLDDAHAMKSDKSIAGVFLAKGSVLLTTETVLMPRAAGQPQSFNLVGESIPETGFRMEASFRTNYPEAQLHSGSFSKDAEFEKLQVVLAEERQAGIEHMACKTWESGAALKPKLDIVRTRADEIKTTRDNFATSAEELREQGTNFLRQLDDFQSSYDATLSDVTARLHESEQDKTEAHIQLLGAQQRSQECLARYVNAFSDQRVKKAQHEVRSCYQDSLEMKQQQLRHVFQQSGLEPARARVQELLTKTEEVDVHASDIIRDLEDRVERATSAFQQAHQVLSIALDRSVVEREKALGEQQLDLATNETKRTVLADAARHGQGNVVEMRKAQGICQVRRKKTEALQKQQEVAMQLKQNLQDLSATMMPANHSQEYGESAENDIQNRADQVFQVFDELTPVPESTPIAATPSPVTTLSGIGPELAMLIKLEIQQTMDKEREKIFADGVKQGRQLQQRVQPSCNIASGSQQEGLASSEPHFDDAASEASVNTVVPVPQEDDGATSQASVNTVVTDRSWIHCAQTAEMAPTGLSEEVDASG